MGWLRSLGISRRSRNQRGKDQRIEASIKRSALFFALCSQKITTVWDRQLERCPSRSVARHGFHDGIYSRLHSENRTLSLRADETEEGGNSLNESLKRRLRILDKSARTVRNEANEEKERESFVNLISSNADVSTRNNNE